MRHRAAVAQKKATAAKDGEPGDDELGGQQPAAPWLPPIMKNKASVAHVTPLAATVRAYVNSGGPRSPTTFAPASAAFLKHRGRGGLFNNGDGANRCGFKGDQVSRYTAQRILWSLGYSRRRITQTRGAALTPEETEAEEERLRMKAGRLTAGRKIDGGNRAINTGEAACRLVCVSKYCYAQWNFAGAPGAKTHGQQCSAGATSHRNFALCAPISADGPAVTPFALSRTGGTDRRLPALAVRTAHADWLTHG